MKHTCRQVGAKKNENVPRIKYGAAKAGIQNTGFPRIKCGAGSVKHGMTKEDFQVKRICELLLMLFSILCLTSSLSLASDWPMFRGNEARTGYTTSDATPPLNLKWTFSAGGAVVSSPVKYGGKVFVGSRDKKIYALDAFTGAKIWEYQTGGWVDSTPAAASGKVYAASWDGNLHCLDAETGSLLWKFTSGGTDISSPLVYNGKVYYTSGYPTNKLFVLDAGTGGFVFSYQLPQPSYSSPAASENTLVASANAGHFYFFNISDNTLKTTFQSQGEVYLFTPSIRENKVFVIASDFTKKLYALNLDTGQEIWNHNLAGSDQFVKVSSTAVKAGTVYISAGQQVQKLFATDEATGNLKWQQNLGNFSEWNYLSSPAIANNVLYVGSASGSLYALDADTGNVLQQLDVGSPVISSPAVASGMVYFGAVNGNIYGYAVVDTTNPVAAFSSLQANQIVGGTTPINGTAGDEHFQKYVLSYGSGDSPQSYTDFLTAYQEVQNGTLGTWDATTLTSGIYTLKLAVYDVADTLSSATVVVQLDNSPPSLTVDSPQDGLITNQKDVVVSGTTEASSIVTVNDTAVAVDAQGGFSTMVSLYEGENIIVVIAKDSLNNATKVTRKVILDTSPLSITISSPVDGLLTNQSPVALSGTVEILTDLSIVHSVSDSASESDAVILTETIGDKLAENIGAMVTVTVNGSNVSVDAQGAFAATVSLSAGENTITVIASDTAGNSKTKTIKVTYDPNAPMLEITHPPDNLVANNKDLTVIGKTEIGASLTINDVSVSMDAEGKFTYALTLAEGENTITIISSDSLGNKITASRKVTLDSKIPELVVDEPADGLITNQTKITVKGKAEVGATLKINDAVAEIGSDGAFSYEFSLQEGDNTLTVIVSDTAGNSMSVTRKVTLDIQPPTGTVGLVTDGKTKGNYVMTKDVTLKLEAQDNLKVAQAAYSLSSDLSSSWKEFTESPMEATLDLGECCGDKTIYVQYKDSAGNVSDADTSAEGSQPYTVTFTYVKDVKTVTLSAPGANPELVDLGAVKVDMETIKSAGDLNFVLNKASFENADGAAEPLELRLEFYNTAGKKSGEETLGRVVTWLYFKYDEQYKGAPLADEYALAVYRYNTKGEWERLSGFQEVNTEENTVKALVPLVLNRNYTFQVVQEKSVSPSTLSVLNYPNPVHGDTTFSYSISSGIPQQVTIEVYALTGKKALSMSVPPPFTGKYTTQEIDRLPNGVYIYRIHVVTAGKTLTKTGKLVLLQ